MTELIWNGKHDKKGKAQVPEDRILPFRLLETVGPSESEGEEVQQDLFRKPKQDTEWRNLLIWGDNRIAMSSLLPQFVGKINLIYADPPFATGRGFSLAVRVGDEASLDQPFMVEERAYRDTWGVGFDAYLQMLHGRLGLMRDLLAEDGSMYVHVGPGVVHYVKAVMDELFGQDCYRNEIIWKRDVAGKGAKRTSSQWPRNAEHILFYSKSPERWFFRQPYRKLGEKQQRVYRYRELDGRRFKTVQLGDYSEESIRRMEREGLIYVSSTGKKYKKYYLDEARDTVDCIWTDILGFGTRTASAEHLGFPTQKPEALLERIVEASSRRGDLVADFFCGSGTTGAVAEKLGRRWILCDLSRHAVHITRKRLLQIESRTPFHLLMLDGYERHKLAEKGFGAGGGEREFILKLYQAEPLSGFEMLHGRKGKAVVHVGSPGNPVTLQEVQKSLEEAGEAGVGEVHFLGWEFEAGLCERVSEVEKEFCVKLRLVPIPREALEVSDPAKEKVRFFDLSHLKLAHEVSGKTVTIAIKDFRPGNPEYLPKGSGAKERRFSDFIDYWAVDWEYRNHTFRNRWRAFRTRKKRKLTLQCSHTYATAGTHKVTVKVVDVFANETKRLIKVEVS